MKILFVLRFDADTKGGGDVNLLRTFYDELRLNHECDLVIGNPENVIGYDKVISANIDRPIEAYGLLRLCQRDDADFYIYALHHPSWGVELYLRFGISGVKRLFAIVAGFDSVRYEQVLWVARIVREAFRGRFLPFGSVSTAQKYILKHSAGVLVVSDMEAQSIGVDIGVADVPFYFVPHALDPRVIDDITIKDHVICPGRIERRKNQLFLLNVAAKMPHVKFLFVGSESASERTYAKRIYSYANKLNNVEFLDELKPGEFYKELLSARVVLTASWFEVTSLIELAVLNNSGVLVCADCSYNDSFFKNKFKFKSGSELDCENKLISALAHKDDEELQNKYMDNKLIASALADALGVGM